MTSQAWCLMAALTDDDDWTEAGVIMYSWFEERHPGTLYDGWRCARKTGHSIRRISRIE